jgi:hypothetical protein
MISGGNMKKILATLTRAIFKSCSLTIGFRKRSYKLKFFYWLASVLLLPVVAHADVDFACMHDCQQRYSNDYCQSKCSYGSNNSSQNSFKAIGALGALYAGEEQARQRQREELETTQRLVELELKMEQLKEQKRLNNERLERKAEPNSASTQVDSQQVRNGGLAELKQGVRYAKGDGVTQDYAEAVKWFRLAAEQGNARAQSFLGLMHAKGDGVTQDYAEAVKWFKLAASRGDADAQANLGVSYDTGKGIGQNFFEAVKWFKLAAEQRHGYGQYSLARMYARGDGISDDWQRDYVRAYMWMDSAAINGFTDATKHRNALARSMTPQQISDAQKLARECRERNFKKCD